MILFLCLAFVLLACLFAGYSWPWWREKQELHAWAKTGISMEEYRARYPRMGNSQEAVELDRLAGPLGIRFLKIPKDDVIAANDKKMYDAINKYNMSIADAADNNQLEQPPADIRRFLDTHRASIEAVVDQLLSSNGISWEMDVGAGLLAPVPALHAHRRLHQLLLVEAMERQRQHDDTSGRRFLQAAYRLKDSLANRPELISQLIVMALASQENAVLRMMPAAAECSPEKTESNFLSGYALALRSEAFAYLNWDPQKLRLDESRGAGERPSFFEVWYGRFGMASASAHLRRGCALILEDNPCALSASEIENEVAGKIARWDLLARIMVPSVWRGWAVALDVELDRERTCLVLEAYKRRQLHDDWGETTAVQSKVCPNLVWFHRRETDGRLTIIPEPIPLQDQRRRRQWAFTLSIPSDSAGT